MTRGPAAWRSLAEFADTAEFRRWAEREFPAVAQDLSRGPSRRRFLQLMAASMALAGLSGCRREDHRILPYHRKPPETVPGTPLYYATTCVLAGEPIGVLAETHEGRPTKLEGHPGHPGSLGALPALAQATILDLYDPDRSRAATRQGQPVDWEAEVVPALGRLAALYAERKGRGLALLFDRHASPAVEMLRGDLARAMPDARSYLFEPLETGGLPDVEADLENADVILSLDCDLLGLEDRGLRYRRAFGTRRGPTRMNRLYVVEPHWTVTGMSADHRLALPASGVAGYAWRLARELGWPEAPDRGDLFDGDDRWVREVAADLKRARGRCAILAGRRQPEAVHALARWMNRMLAAPVRAWAPTPGYGTLDELAAQVEAGEVETLALFGANPVHAAPADLDVAGLLDRVPTTIHVGLYHDETAQRCTWHIPQAHYLESWGDARAGTAYSPVQPVIAPLLGGRSPLEILARLAGSSTTDPYAIVQKSFRVLTGGGNFEARWRSFLNEGVTQVADARRAAPPVTPERVAALPEPATGADDGPFELCFSADESVYDGRFANNGWLQECPDPVTKLSWDNAAVLSPVTAETLKVENGDFLRLEAAGRALEIAAFVVPGVADGTIQLPLGYGRPAAGALGRHAGVDVYPLRTRGAPWFVRGAAARATGASRPQATTQEHWAIRTHELVDGVLADRAIVREGTLAHFREEPDFARHMGMHLPEARDIADRPPFDGEHQWGMAIDLSRCLGCTACVVACQAENNIPLVGPDEVRRGREMHWIRIDRYFRGDDPRAEVEVSNQPMLCQHCENAPCEPVCPVNATVHDEEGLNVMVYNRCVGTRYCSNNCPYKVRRFNFFDYNKGTLREGGAPFDGDNEPDPRRGLSRPQFAQPPIGELETMQKNPDVTVRIRGVMEKCTFCVQRIAAAKIARKVAAGQTPAGKVPDAGLLTACQQACPTGAIAFGDLADATSRVARMHADPRGYPVLEHLNTRPRTRYLARLRNRNPAMPGAFGPRGGKERHG